MFVIIRKRKGNASGSRVAIEDSLEETENHGDRVNVLSRNAVCDRMLSRVLDGSMPVPWVRWDVELGTVRIACVSLGDANADDAGLYRPRPSLMTVSASLVST